MTRVREVTPAVDAAALLAGAQFIDAYCVEIGERALDARQACIRMVLHGPRWIDALLRLRNIAVAPFGLKTSGAGEPAPGGLIGLFPVVSETPERLVAGFDDYHLDFRLVVEIAGHAAARRVTSTTLVRTHNLPGTDLSRAHHAVPQAGRARHDAPDRGAGPIVLRQPVRDADPCSGIFPTLI